MRIDPIKLVSSLKRRDLTQKRLSEIADVSRSTINGIAAGRSCSQDSAEKIAAALKVELSDLLDDEEV